MRSQILNHRYSRYIHSSGLPLSQTWKILKLNHIAIAYQNIDAPSKFYSQMLALPTSPRQSLPDHGVITVFVQLGSNETGPKLELLEPLGDNSPIKAFLEKNPRGGIHHICYEVDSLETALKDLDSKHNIRPIHPPSIGAHGKSVVFIHPKHAHGVLIELEQA